MLACSKNNHTNDGKGRQGSLFPFLDINANGGFLE